MFETSRDFLNLTIAGAIALFTLFVCWIIYYFIKTLRNMATITTSIKDKMKTIDKILHLVQEKLEKGSNHMAMVADSAIKLVGYFMDKQSGGKSGGKKKKREWVSQDRAQI